ncbi:MULTISPECIES: hypothetical protein [Rhizobium/Agrobacterium group]|uniref:hypothetical protein n=1 Tax=Rhizobium/Agrobacterium group TaxID=227290 RepID=UPI0003F212FF|nr:MULTISPECIES: hypothetical protein [Rhizobium/Agrobacterium group]AHK03905.1 hypothetical protein X971_4056 [Agrobacterium tumefaciens LBA4213 (Ach5)]AKC09658.1 hypothetical protein Ach5_38850 [Agrobacterium tumefaciens]AYM18802.1 hypothetical protein At15955_38170 [Agrobacterium tumefaciens]AYM70101.1 hypothetical protein AtA6_38850 [Agrobacterium tumefaciens]NIB58885.1 hypothetical protein [Agrobacterium tumefaciens]
MSQISGISGSAGLDAEPNAAQALLSIAAPPLAPNDDNFVAASEEDNLIAPVENRPERGFPKASWLDAMPPEAFEAADREPDHISSVNSDDNGLYRMFISVSP